MHPRLPLTLLAIVLFPIILALPGSAQSTGLLAPEAVDQRKIGIVEVASEYGAGTRGSSLGPDGIATACLNEDAPVCRDFYPPVGRIQAEKAPLFGPTHEHAKYAGEILEVNRKVKKAVETALGRGLFPVILHGDHSNTIGTVAATAGLGPKQCLVYMDAHGDLHSPWTTPSGNVHGMPVLAAVRGKHRDEDRKNDVRRPVEELWKQLTHLTRAPAVALDGGVVLIGTRSTEAPERHFIEDHKIREFKVKEVRERGPEIVVKEILARFRKARCSHFVVSVDIDVLDARLVPGTGTPEPNGFEIDEVRSLLRGLSPYMKALEISEVSPPRDQANKTSRAAVELLQALR